MEANDKPKQLVMTDLFTKGQLILRYIFGKWPLLLTAGCVGAVVGLGYSLLVKPKYTAVCTFVLEENSREGMLGQYSGLAALAGIDVDGGGGGIFKGDNIIELYKSRLMIKKTLLTVVGDEGQREKLIERYIAFNQLREKWNKNGIRFDIDTSKYGRKQDSVITDIAERFDRGQLEVAKPDKKLSILRVAFTAKDEFFAKTFTDKLVENVNNFYVDTKTKKLAEDVSILQRQADSVKHALNQSINGVASAIESAPLANPILTSLRSSPQKKQVDVQSGSAIYGEIIKNLELSKISLRQQTPLIQFIDQPVYPLKNDRVSLLKGIVIGGLLALFFSAFFLAIKKITRYENL